jgi:hypothetical protein
MEAEIRSAIKKHAEWKTHLSNAIRTGQTTLSIDEVARDDCCRFGHWLYALDGEVRSTHRWRCVQQVHADFHRHAAAVLKLAVSGKASAARAALSYSSGFAQTSARLTVELTAWQKAAPASATATLAARGDG